MGMPEVKVDVGGPEPVVQCASTPAVSTDNTSKTRDHEGMSPMSGHTSDGTNYSCTLCLKSFPGCSFDTSADEDAKEGAGFRCPPCVVTAQTRSRLSQLPATERDRRVAALAPLHALVIKLRQHPSAKPFLHPVDPVRLRVPDYYRHVREPMDLDLVKLRLSKGFYAATGEVFADVQRVWDNACAFNPPSSIVYRFAQECQAFWAEHVAQAEAEAREAAHAARARKPKARAGGHTPPAGEASSGHSEGEAGKTPGPGEEAGLTTGSGRVRKAKVRWEPEEITAGCDKKKVSRVEPGPAPAGSAGKEAAPARKAKRSSGPLRGVPSADASGSAPVHAHLPLAAYASAEEALGALSPHLLPERHGAALLDVAAAAAGLPEIDVGDDLEGVACNLDGLLEDLPV